MSTLSLCVCICIHRCVCVYVLWQLQVPRRRRKTLWYITVPSFPGASHSSRKRGRAGNWDLPWGDSQIPGITWLEMVGLWIQSQVSLMVAPMFLNQPALEAKGMLTGWIWTPLFLGKWQNWDSGQLNDSEINLYPEPIPDLYFLGQL